MLNSFCQDIYPTLCKKFPNRNIYLISDYHFYHDKIIQYSRNLFSNVLQMNQYIIDSHNEIVNDEDIVIFLGDFCFNNGETSSILNKLNGHKFLILGNHDSEKLLKKYPTLGFEGVFASPVRLQGDYLSHEPLSWGEIELIYNLLLF